MAIRAYIKLTPVQQIELNELFGRMLMNPGSALMGQVWKDGMVVSIIDEKMVDSIQVITGQSGKSKSAIDCFNKGGAKHILAAFGEEDHTA